MRTFNRRRHAVFVESAMRPRRSCLYNKLPRSLPEPLYGVLEASLDGRLNRVFV